MLSFNDRQTGIQNWTRMQQKSNSTSRPLRGSISSSRKWKNYQKVKSKLNVTLGGWKKVTTNLQNQNHSSNLVKMKLTT